MQKNILFLTYILSSALPVVAQSYATDMIASWEQDLDNIELAQKNLKKEKQPEGKWFPNRLEKHIFTTNQEVKELLLEMRKSMVELKIALAHEKKHVIQLIQALTYFVYIMSAAVIIFVPIYAYRR